MEKPITVGEFMPDKVELAGLLKNKLVPNDVIIKELCRQGARSLMHAFCITKLTNEQMVGKLWSPVKGVRAFHAILNFEERKVIDRPLNYPTSVEDYIKMKVVSYPRYIEGKVMSLYIACGEPDFPMKRDDLFKLTVSKLRLMGGAGAIVDVVQIKNISLPDGKTSEAHDVPPISSWHMRGPHSDDSWNEAEKSSTASHFQ